MTDSYSWSAMDHGAWSKLKSTFLSHIYVIRIVLNGDPIFEKLTWNVLKVNLFSFFVFLDKNDEIQRYPERYIIALPKGYPQKAQSWELGNLRRRKVAPQSEIPIGVRNRDAVKLIGSAYRSALVVFPLPMHAVERRRPHRRHQAEVKTRGGDSGFTFRVGSCRVYATESGANVIEKHCLFGVCFPLFFLRGCLVGRLGDPFCFLAFFFSLKSKRIYNSTWSHELWRWRKRNNHLFMYIGLRVKIDLRIIYICFLERDMYIFT